MNTDKIKALFKKYKSSDAPPKGKLDGRYYEIRVDQSGKAEIHWQNTVYLITGKERLRVQVLNGQSKKSCQKCGEEFISNKFTPYQKYCRDCGSHAPKPDYEEKICPNCDHIWPRSKFNPYIETCPDCRKENLKALENRDGVIKQPV